MTQPLTQHEILPGGLIEQVTPERGGLANPPAALRQRVVSHLDKVRGVGGGDWTFYENPDRSSADIETQNWALSALSHVHAHDVIQSVRDPVLARLEAFFNPAMGIYETYQTQLGPLAYGHWRIHNDAVCRIGFRVLGAEARPWPRGVEHLRNFPWAWQPGTDLDHWLDLAWAHGPRRGAKEVSQFLYIYCHLMGIATVSQFDPVARHVLDFLEAQRDPTTAYISAGPDINLGWAMRGHRNFVLAIHWRYGIPEPRLEQLIDSTLATQRDDGLFHDGSMCANVDAVQLLAEYGLRTEKRYRCDEIIRSCRRCVAGIYQHLSDPAGGFHYELGKPTPARLTNGLSFVLSTLRYWQAIDDQARGDLGALLPH